MACAEPKANNNQSYSINRGIADEEFTTEEIENETAPSNSHRLIQITSYSTLRENPEPSQKDNEDADLFEEYLSPRKLQSLTGCTNLGEVNYLEIRVNTTDNTLGNFGIWLPNLYELKLTNSIISSVRDLGTSLVNLKILWMPRCQLNEVDGISCLSSLKELYLAYNTINDISPISMLENIEVLDLEGNGVNSSSQIGFLTLCPALVTLTLEGNPVCFSPDINASQEEIENYNYKNTVRTTLPNLKFIDNEPVDQIAFDMVDEKQHIEDRSYQEQYENMAHTPPINQRPNSGRLKSESQILRRPQSVASTRSVSPMLTPTPSSLDQTSTLLMENDNSSSLTHGSSEVICGNPVRALRSRKKNKDLLSKSMDAFKSYKTATAVLYSSTPSTTGFHPEHTYEEESRGSISKEDVITELKAWKTQYERVTLGIDNIEMSAIQESESEESPRNESKKTINPLPPTPTRPKAPTTRPRTASDYRTRKFKKGFITQSTTSLTSRSEKELSANKMRRSYDETLLGESGDPRVHSAVVKHEIDRVDIIRRPITRAGFHTRAKSQGL
ncbi:Leucine-rich repeat-containing protein 56 [Trichoplax sp. H2]|uniref:Leucine-rich repeat-containing protein 56 n=1 Tax=Trichoplax adhaerens TaxID=10228 RepID=B3RK48_TRIAD|nr:hypothetical protein TRIADDRAFT_51623 [Trichoplax adhaerens]EDV29377.1 hypothetical protein TRIADDRAFT_51623 [Trichoplax adhaerens]RDD41505.1 Leucine-rich repeat-containing protein 56 [Trichoplax sp. H2]|eukprot:XP_002108579.1 hypothetical protein TRIADDRAFT_51623 [Trichoplax adhaerens]